MAVQNGGMGERQVDEIKNIFGCAVVPSACPLQLYDWFQAIF